MDKRNIAAIIGVIAIIAITATAAYVGNNAGSDQINSTESGQTVQITNRQDGNDNVCMDSYPMVLKDCSSIERYTYSR
jgi:hypothetical protein